MIKNKKGFSLIELLAVIVILGIILAISTVAVNSIRAKQAAENRRNTISGILTGARRFAADNNTLADLDSTTKKTKNILIKDIVDNGYADMDTNEYSDIYKDTEQVTVSICSGNTNKVKYSYTDPDSGTTYNDCGCDSQPQSDDVQASELCTG